MRSTLITGAAVLATRLGALGVPVVALITASAAGGCVIAAEAELPDVEVTNHGIAIPAAPAEADGNEVSLSVSYRQKPNRAGLPKDAFESVRILSVRVGASTGLADLNFLRALRITATTKENEAAGRAPIEIARYSRPAKPATGTALEMPSNPPPDVTALWKSSEVIFTLDVTGQLPTVAWTADVALRVGATLVY